MPKHVGNELVLYRSRENPRPPTDSPDMRRGKRRVHIVDADGKAQGEISESSQSTTNPAPNYQPSQSAAGGRPAAPRSSSHVRTSAGNMKGKAPSRYRTHTKPQRSGANRSDVSPDEGPSTRRHSARSMPPQYARSANPFMEGTSHSYDYEAPSKYSLRTRPQSMYSTVPDLVPYVGYSNPYAAGSYTMPQHMAQFLYSQVPPPAPPTESPAPPKTPAPPPPPQKKDEEDVEITKLRKQLELLKQEQNRREELEKQKEFENKIRKEAEQTMAKRIEEMKLAQEQARMEIEKAKIEATMAARQAVEAERRAEEERRRLEEEDLERCRRMAEEKIAAEVRAEAERIRLQKEEADRLSREMQAKIDQQQEERRRLQQQEKEDLERLRQEIIEQVRAEMLERERRYLSSSSGSRSFSSRSSRSSNSYLSSSSTSESGSNDSGSRKRRSRKSGLGRAAKVPSIIPSEDIKPSTLEVEEAEAPASVPGEDALTLPPDPFVYFVGTSTPPPETEEDSGTPPDLPWKQTGYTTEWHYQPYMTHSRDQNFVYQNVSGNAEYQSQLWSLPPGDDEIGSSSSSETASSDDHLSNLEINNRFQEEPSSDEESETGTVIPASNPRQTPELDREDLRSGNATTEDVLTESGPKQSKTTVGPDVAESENRLHAISIREGPGSLRTPFKYLVTEEEADQDDDNVDGGANLASQNSPQMTKKTAPDSANYENLTGIKRPVPTQTSPALASSSPNSPLLPLLAKHISDYEDEIVQRNKSRNSYYEPTVPLSMVNNWSYFPPYPASLTSGSNWPGDEMPKVVFPYYMSGGHGRGLMDDVLSRQTVSTRSSSSLSSESEPEVPMALVPCIMIPLSMLQSSKYAPRLYMGGDSQ